jgi:hypothetical protein
MTPGRLFYREYVYVQRADLTHYVVGETCVSVREIEMKAIVRNISLGLMALAIGAGNVDAFNIQWSQQPNLVPRDGYAYSSESQVSSEVADDFMLDVDMDIAKIRWWGSYWEPVRGQDNFYPWYYSNSWGDPQATPPAPVTKFSIRILRNAEPTPTGTPPWPAPGAQVVSVGNFDLGAPGGVTETLYDTINHPSGITQTVYQYEVDVSVPSTSLAEGTVYWLSIQAENFGANPVQWGWQNAVPLLDGQEERLAEATQIGFQEPSGWWHALPGTDMAFEIELVPLPSSIVLMGMGALAVLRRKRRV